jgi:hypothetical protein
MNKDQQYKIFFENWKKYVQEQVFDLPKTKTYKSKFPDKKSKTTFEPPKFDISNQARLSDTLKKLGATIDAEDPDFMDTMSKAICGLLNQMGVFMQLESDLDNQDKTTESSAGGFSGWLLKQVGKAASISGEILQQIAEFLPGCDGYDKLKQKWEKKQKKKKEKTSTGTATGTTTTTTTKNGKKVKIEIKLPKCTPDETRWNKACWEYYYSEEFSDSEKEKKAKIEAAKQKARDFIASKQKKTEKPAPVKSTAETGKYVNLYSKITGQSVEAKQKRKQEREAIRAIAAEAQQKFPTDWTQDTEFLSKVKAWSDKHGVPMQNILALIYHETAFTMSPGKVGSNGCTGLIMFCPNSGMQLIKKDGRQLAAMTRAEQWDYVEMFLDKNDKWKKDPKNIASLYLAVFLPAFADLPDNAVIASKFGKKDPNLHPRVRNFSDKIIKSWWRQNPANRDRKDKNRITKSGLKPILSKYIPKLSQFANNDYRSQDIKISDAPPPAGVGGSISSIPGRDR